MRSAIVRIPLAALLLATAGCSSPKVPPAAPAPAAEPPPGNTGFPGLDWGANLDDVTGTYPQARPEGGGLTWAGMVHGMPAVTRVAMSGDGLEQIQVVWDVRFESMEACGEALHQVRPRLDARFGPGPEENLAVYWDTATASVVLACNPESDGSTEARLTEVHIRRAAE